MKEGLTFRNPYYVLATWFGAGCLPRMPGTWGSLAAFPFWYFGLRYLPWEATLLVVTLVMVVGIVVSRHLLEHTPHKDPSYIVIDEVVGLWVALFFTKTFLGGVVGFFLFRLFDIWKPGIIGWADRLGEKEECFSLSLKETQAVSIMLDDIIAGLFALLCLFCVDLIGIKFF